jgi:hypothetical protein
MSVIRHTFLILSSLLILAATATAQSAGAAREQRPAARSVVTAGASASGARFVSTEGARRMRLEVYTAAGERLFDSDFRAGSIIDWDGQGLSDGSYLCVVTVEDLQGGLSRRLSAVTLRGGHATVGSDGGEQLKAAYPRALAAAGLTNVDEAAAAARQKGKAQAVTVTAHDGQDGQVTSTKGALTLRTGDVFTGQDKEQMRVTPEGRVGIGTSDPQATLDVAGTIRARGGIVFEDGTTLTSAHALAPQGIAVVTGADTTVGPNIAGTGTTGRLSKWLDAAGTLGDSILSESNGNVVVNGGNIQMTATPSKSFDSNVLFMDNNSKTAGFIASSTPAFLASNGPYFAMRGNDYALYSNQRGALSISAGNVAGATASEGSIRFFTGADQMRMMIDNTGRIGMGTTAPTQKLEVAGNLKISGAGNGLIFPDGSIMTTASGAPGSTPSGTSIITAINDPSTVGVINDNHLAPNLARVGAANNWTATQTFSAGLSANGVQVVNVGNPVSGTDAVNKNYVDATTVKFAPAAEQLSVGDANGTAPMINLRGGSTCCSGPGGHTPAFFKVYQNGSFVATGNLGIGVSPMEGKGYRTSWHTYKGAFRSGYADNEWDDANTGFFSWAGGSNSTASGLYAFAFGDTNFASSTSSIAFGSGNEVKGAAGFSAGAGNRVCDTYGVAFGNKAQSGGPLINGKCDPDSFNITGLAAVALGYNVTADKDHSTAMGKFASNNGFSGTFIWSDGSATASVDTFKNTANNEFAARATGGFRFRTNLTGTTGCNLPAGSGVFNCTSSRTTKENFSPVSGADVLASLRKVPVSTWNYISEGGQTRHLGPMAEDFYAAFGLGTSDKAIGIQDAVGVSLAAVKALDERTIELQKKTEEVEQLRSKLNTLEQRLAALEQAMQSNAKPSEGQQK